jgi:hypothetical protein
MEWNMDARVVKDTKLGAQADSVPIYKLFILNNLNILN